jgi:hypothetical protein
VPADAQLNLFPAFREAGLLSVDDKGKMVEWKALPWPSGGCVAIVLKDPKDGAVASKVRDLLARLKTDPTNGIGRVLEADELHQRGGFSNASFLVSLMPGWKSSIGLDGPVLTRTKPCGTHGALPETPGLYAAFFLIGPHIPVGRSLGVIDMRDIAPTLAHVVGLSLPTADGKVLLP